MDRPGHLKNQEAPVPYLGGIAVFAGVAIGVCVGRPVALVPLAVALAVGVSDDRFDLPAPARLAAQLGVGAVIVIVQPVHLPGWIGTPLILAVTVVLINGFNFLDGLDMLAAGVGAAAGVGFAFVLSGPGRLVAAALAGALVAFLLYNLPSGTHLSRRRRFVPDRRVHDRAPHLCLGCRHHLGDGRARPGPAGGSGGRGGVRRGATEAEWPLDVGR